MKPLTLTRYLTFFLLLTSLFNLPLGLAQAQDTCPGDFLSRLSKGQAARVTPGASNRVRAEPTTDSEVRGTLSEEYVLVVLDGPVCADGYVWWYIYTPYADGSVLFGWTVEGHGQDYWLAPMDAESLTCQWQNNEWGDVSLSFFDLGETASDYSFYDAAVLFYTCQIRTDDTGEPHGYVFRGEAYQQLGNYDAALADFNTMIAYLEATSGFFHSALNARARLYLEIGEYQLAMEDVNRVLAEDERYQVSYRYETLYIRGQLYEVQGRYALAEADYQAAIQLYEDNVIGNYPAMEERLRLGDLYTQQQRYTEAVEQYYRAAYGLSRIHGRTFSDFAPITLRLGRAYDGLNFDSQAMGAYQLYLMGIQEDEAPPDEQAVRRLEALRAQGTQPFIPTFILPDPSTLGDKTYIGAEAVSSQGIPSKSELCGLDWSPDGTTVAANYVLYQPGVDEPNPRSFGEVPYDIAFTPDSTRLLAAYRDTIQLWDVSTGSLLDSWDGQYLVAVSPDGELVAFVNHDEVVVRHLSSGDVAYQVPFSSSASDLAFSPDSSLLAIASGGWQEQDRYFVLIDVKGGQFLRRINTFDRVVSIAFSSDGQLLGTVEREVISLWHVETGTLLGMVGTNLYLTDKGAMTFSADGQLFAATRGFEFVIYETQTGNVIAYVRETERFGQGYPICLAFHPQDNRIAAIIYGEAGQTLYIWDVDAMR